MLRKELIRFAMTCVFEFAAFESWCVAWTNQNRPRAYVIYNDTVELEISALHSAAFRFKSGISDFCQK